MLIRRESPPADVDAIDEIHRQAFAEQAPIDLEPVEVGLVRALRADRGWVAALSLVAEGPNGEILGHVVATEGVVDDGRTTTTALGLGPIGVLPHHQGRRVGHALMHSVLAAAEALDYPVVALLGHTEYYPRFGFVPAAIAGITAPDPSWGEHFQARRLSACPAGLSGTFRYAAPFDQI